MSNNETGSSSIAHIVMRHVPFEKFIAKERVSDVPEELLADQYVRIIETCVRRVMLDCMVEFGPEVQEAVTTLLDKPDTTREDLDAFVLRAADEYGVELEPYIHTVVEECIGA